MLDLLKQEFLNIVNNIDSGNTYMTEEDQLKTINFLRNISSPTLNATQAAEYLGVCRNTFDNYVKSGKLPKGEKIQGGVNVWLKTDLEKWKQEIIKKT